MKDTKTYRCLTPDCPNVEQEITVRGKKVKAALDFDIVEGKPLIVQRYEFEANTPKYLSFPQIYCAHCGIPPMEVQK